jgi:tetratricopeptide (TPR) repeat protein
MEDSLDIATTTRKHTATRHGRFGRIQMVVAILLVALVGSAYSIKNRPDATSGDGVPAGSTQELMRIGMVLLYSGHDPDRAASHFRAVLALNSDHYGATYQLATALDRSGRVSEARPHWEKMRRMAEAFQDAPTAATARARLDQPAPVAPMTEENSQAAMMAAGNHALYTKADIKTAITEFRKVLQRNPTHYGATYQLAVALDHAGKRQEARAMWQKVLKMAEGYKDVETGATALARLAQKP